MNILKKSGLSVAFLSFRIWRVEKFRFLFVGGLNTAFGIGIFPLLFFLLEPLKFHYLIVLVISWFFATSLSFMTNRHLVFRSLGNFFSEYLRFIPYHALILVFNLVFLPIAVRYFSINVIVLQIVYTCAVVALNYFWYKNIIFK